MKDILEEILVVYGSFNVLKNVRNQKVKFGDLEYILMILWYVKQQFMLESSMISVISSFKAGYHRNDRIVEVLKGPIINTFESTINREIKSIEFYHYRGSFMVTTYVPLHLNRSKLWE